MSEVPQLSKSRVSAAAPAQRKSKSTDPHPGRSISTLIIGRFGFYSEGLRRILECNRFCNITQLPMLQSLKNSQAASPQLIIFTGISSNSDLPGIVSSLRMNNSDTRIVVFLDEKCPDQIENAMSIPAHAFLSADISPTALINALDVVFGDGGVLSINFAEYLTARHRQCEAKPAKAAQAEPRLFLSSRETDILRCLTDGISNKHIARQFGIAESTVKIHVKSILRKINVQNRIQAAIWALANYPRPETVELIAANSIKRSPLLIDEKRLPASAGA